MNQYDHPDFFAAYAQMSRSRLGLLGAGFSLTAVEEALPPEEWRVQMPDEMRRPMMLLVKAENARGGCYGEE